MTTTSYPSTDFQAARENMIENQIRCCKILDDDVLELMESMPRENFVPDEVKSLAYMEGRVPLPCNQEMLSPLQEAKILQTFALQGGERVLEIGTGTGFLTTMLAMQAGEVVSCEIHETLFQQAQQNIVNHGINNAKLIHINAMDEAAVAAHPDLQDGFDAIVIAAAVESSPAHIEALLNDGGQMIVFVGSNPLSRMVHKQKVGNSWQSRDIFETLIQEIEGVPEKRQFIF